MNSKKSLTVQSGYKAEVQAISLNKKIQVRKFGTLH